MKGAQGGLRPIIFGTAGHIDHGKTTLTRALTGQNTDRLPEEKSRGISIDLGFAHFVLNNGQRAALIDVPGHEKFVRNMVSGVHGMDAVMLVVAADEGVMPQTQEHLDILQLLGVRHGLTVVTKADMVEEDFIDWSKRWSKRRWRGTFLAHALWSWSTPCPGGDSKNCTMPLLRSRSRLNPGPPMGQRGSPSIAYFC